MYEYFKTMHLVANSNSKEYTGIRELTLDIAKSGGYRRELVKLKNGKLVMRTAYNNPSTWDNTLVAKWFCYYEDLFKGKLKNLPELREYFITIVERTFMIYFKSLQVDKLKTDAMVTKFVNMCLYNRIGEVFILIGSDERAKRNKAYKTGEVRKSRDRYKKSEYVNSTSVSLDELAESNIIMASDEDEKSSDLVLDILCRIGNNKYGKRLLYGMLYSERAIELDKIQNYVKIDKEDMNKDTKQQIADSYNTIVDTLREYEPSYEYKNITEKDVGLRKVSKKIQELTM